jgi:transketolase
VPVLDPARYPAVTDGLWRGAYVLADSSHNGGDGRDQGQQTDIILVATGSEVHVALAAAEALGQDGVAARVVSMPCWEFFVQQPKPYQQEVFVPGVPVLAVEAGVSLGWQTYLGTGVPAIAVDTFGTSAPGEEVLDRYGFNAENVRRHALRLLERTSETEKERGTTDLPGYG